MFKSKNYLVKSLLMLSMAFVLLLGSFGFSNQQASAASTYTSWYWEHPMAYYPILHGLSTSDGAGVVYASLVQGEQTDGYSCNGCQFNWKMELQRQTEGYDTWVTIGTHTGYVMYDDPSNRTFTNVGTLNTFLRIKLTVTGEGTFYSKAWVR